MERARLISKERQNERVTIRDVLRDAKLDHATAYRYFGLAGDPKEDLPIDHFNEEPAARAAGYPTFAALDAAWRTTLVAPYVPRGGGRTVPEWVEKEAARGQLPTLNMTPHALIKAVRKLSHEAQVELVQALDGDVLAEAVQVPREQASDTPRHHPKGVLLNHQLDAFAEAQDLAAFKAIVREVEKQIKARE